jgi:hypothetical protein
VKKIKNGTRAASGGGQVELGFEAEVGRESSVNK